MGFVKIYAVITALAIGGYAFSLFAGWQPFGADGTRDHMPAGVAGNRSAYPSFWATGFGGK
ncbi:MAG: hypothetical protein IPK60_04545 [Sandaracinaceae bacterium]|nr:hypothetical protein [Sandaracinaceae bacterium]